MAATAIRGQICDGQISRNICNILVYMSAKFGAFITKCTILWIFELCCQTITSQNQRMDGLPLCYEQLGVWCNFNIPWLDSLPRPLFWGRWGNCPKFRQKFDGALIHRPVIAKRHNIRKLANMLVKLCKSPCNHFRGRVADSLYTSLFKNVTITLLPFARWRQCRADSVLLWRMT